MLVATCRRLPYITLPNRRSTSSLPLVHIPPCSIHALGAPPSSPPLFTSFAWTIHPSHAWCVLGSGTTSKSTLLSLLAGAHRLHPPPPPPHGRFPRWSAAGADPFREVAEVSFAHRARGAGAGFLDYSARYGAVREEDRITLRERLFKEGGGGMDGRKKEVLERLGLRELLDLPYVALSNGQTRRARVARALISAPGMLVLDEPLTGLDVETREILLKVLHEGHLRQAPHVVLGLRAHDPLPSWITYVMDADHAPGRAWAGRREDWRPASTGVLQPAQANTIRNDAASTEPSREPLVDMKNVNVAYHGRQVLKNITWTIHPNTRWHLRGPNGSGKTTLLALLTGDHPQSYTQRPPVHPSTHLHLFGRPRHALPTVELARRVGVASPEIANALPRRAGVSVWDVVGAGCDGAFVARGPRDVGDALSEEEEDVRVRRVWGLLAALGPDGWAAQESGGESGGEVSEATCAFARAEFVSLPPGAQACVLLARAMAGAPRLLLLDEVWAGMDARMVAAARRWLTGAGVSREQAVVVVSHWEGEVPWREVSRARLEAGRLVVE